MTEKYKWSIYESETTQDKYVVVEIKFEVHLHSFHVIQMGKNINKF